MDEQVRSTPSIATFDRVAHRSIQAIARRAVPALGDFAMVFIEAARYLGFGARFVSGYLYDPALDRGDATQAVAATHAWAEVYLPGAGWIEYDPTDVLIAGENLIRVAVTRDPSQAIPISGSYVGTTADFLGMTVEVAVTAQN